MGLTFLSSNGYAKDPRKKDGYFVFGLSQIFTEPHKDTDNSENPWHRWPYTFTLMASFDNFRTFVEGTTYIGEYFEQTGTFNWILARSNEKRSNFVWLYAGGGFSSLWVVADKKDGRKYYGTHIGLKGFMGQLYLDVRLNFFFNESLPLFSGYPSITLGFWL